MLETNLLESKPVTDRILSIDVLRGFTVLVMIFVNDVAGVIGTPGWMRHILPPNDGMSFVDVVFPAFLFIVGMSIPFAIGKRIQKGDSLLKVWKHILVRTIGLLIIGVFMVNTPSLSKDAIIGKQAWILLMYTGVILVWNKLPGISENKSKLSLVIKSIGIILLVSAALLFKGNNQTGIIQMTTQWWGILGLIGWAYLIACLFYIPMRKSIAGVMGAVAILYCVYIADETGYFTGFRFISDFVNIGKFLGTHSAIVVSGIVLGMILTPDSGLKTHGSRLRWAFWYGVGLAFSGSMLHQPSVLSEIFIISKQTATPAWGLWSSAITVWTFVIIYWLMDVKGFKFGSKFLQMAGNNALFAYILAPILNTIFVLISQAIGFYFYSWLGSSFEVGLIRSIIFAILTTYLAGYLQKKGFWLKL